MSSAAPLTLAGHQRTVDLLEEEHRAGRVHHAYLITGIAQLGKRTLAESMAARLLCSEANAPCQECADCKLRRAGHHPDLVVIGREDKPSIESIRKLQQTLSIKPHTAEYRVALIIDAERFRMEAHNALLKTLEEPPPQTVLILTASSPAALLATTVSRCRHLPLGRVSSAELGISLDTLSVDVLQAAAGRPGRAIELLADPERMADVKRWEEEFTQAASAPPDRRLALAKQLADEEEAALLQRLDHWIEAHHQALHAEAGDGGSSSVFVQEIARRFTAAQIADNTQTLLAARAALRYNPNVLLLLENSLLKLGEA